MNEIPLIEPSIINLTLMFLKWGFPGCVHFQEGNFQFLLIHGDLVESGVTSWEASELSDEEAL